MPEEMNLYKRCKNIFKFHGVDMGGGESAPEVENAIETHGLGWTESGVETILVDNERVTTVIDDETDSVCGRFITPFDIVDGAYTVIFNGTEYNLNSAFSEEASFWCLGDMFESGPDFSRYPFMIAGQGGAGVLCTESAGDYDVTIKAELDTIHKIDEKYIPGDIFRVEFTWASGDNWICNHTYEEIDAATSNGKKINAYYDYHPCFGVYVTGGVAEFAFIFDVSNQGLIIRVFSVSADGTVECRNSELQFDS